tara:strand:- start:6658 stop:7344 length:687 start_codon:yes stop_codon:yes gene_type:complete
MSEEIFPLRVCDVVQIFKQGQTDIPVLNGANIELKMGEIVALIGPSGSGKSTFLQIAGLLEEPNSGSIFINGINLSGISDKQRSLLRAKDLGFVYQYHHLLPEFSALENIVLPQMLNRISKVNASAKAEELLEQLELTDRAQHRPANLSGGEQQRVAIARALANNPNVLLADEPTGNLDYETAKNVFDTLLDLVRNKGLAAIIATHNRDLIKKMDRAVTILNGKIVPV